MTKADIVQVVYSRLGGFSKKESADLVDLAFEMMKETLGRGEKIKISGFGNFVLRDKRQRRGRNPQTGQPLTITERRVLTFKASQILKSILNPDDDGDGDSGEKGSGSPLAQSSTSSANAGGANGSVAAHSARPAARAAAQGAGQGERR